MAEGGLDVDTDVNETLSSCTDASPSVTDVLAVTVYELRTELRIRGTSFIGGTKPELQTLLLQCLGNVRTHHESKHDPTSLETFAEETAPVATRQPVTIARTVPPPFAPSVPDYTLPTPARSPGPPRVSRESTDFPDPVRPLELQIELSRLEIEAQQHHSEAQERNRQFEAQQHQWDAQQRQLEAEERDKERDFELRRRKLQL